MENSTFLDQLAELFSHQEEPPTDPNKFITSLGAPSVSIAILDHGEVVAQCFSTVGDDTNTLFQACSISKPIACMAFLRLEDQGKVRIEDKIAEFLPSQIVYALGPPALAHEITFEHILSHTAGLSTTGFIGYSNNDHPSAVEVILGKYPVNSIPVKIVGIPGRQYSYSGGGFTLLQIALEKITSKPFSILMDELVLQPLKMTNSHYSTTKGQSNLATPYFNSVTPSSQWHYFAELAAAGLWTTPSDLLKVIHAVQNSLQSEEGDSTFLKPSTAKQMLTQVEGSSMSLSWVAPKDPGTYFGHIGSNEPGYRCVVMGIADLTGEKKEFLNAGCGIAVMTNAESGSTPAFTALQTISFLKGWSEWSTTVSSMPFVTPLKSLNSKIRSDWREWEGTWSDSWTIYSGEDGNPLARWRDLRPICLLTAAICPKVFEEGESLDLVLDGLGGMMRFAWRDGKQSIDYWDCLTFQVTKLDRCEPKIHDKPYAEADLSTTF